MSNNTDIEELRNTVKSIVSYNDKYIELRTSNIMSLIKNYTEQKIIEARIETSSIIKKWMVDYHKEEHDSFSNIGGVTIRRISNMQDKLNSQLNHNKKGDSDEQ